MDITRDYRRQFREAQETNNTHKMAELFEALCNEADIPDPDRDQSQAAAGRELASLRNNRGQGGKKV